MVDKKVKAAFKKIQAANEKVREAEAAAEEARKVVSYAKAALQATFREALGRDVLGDRAYEIKGSVYILQRKMISRYAPPTDDMTHELLIIPVSKQSRPQPVS